MVRLVNETSGSGIKPCWGTLFTVTLKLLITNLFLTIGVVPPYRNDVAKML